MPILARQQTKTKSNRMQCKQQAFQSVIKIVSCALLVLGAAAQAQDKKIDPAGTWTWTTPPGGGGGADRTNTLTLKMEASKLTGKVSAPNRDGQLVESTVADVKVDGENISFIAIREVGGNSRTNKYTGKIAGDKITGKMEFTRQGEVQTRDWEARRTTQKK